MKQFVESFKRLYEKGLLPKEKIMALYKDGKIAENEKVKTFKCDRTPDWDKAFQRFCEILKK